MNNLKFKHKNTYTINTTDNSAEFDLYNMAGNVIDTFLIDIEELAYGDHHRLKFVPTNRPNTRAYLHVGTIDSPDVGNAWFAEISIPTKNDKKLISRIKFLSRTHREKAKPLTVYAAYLIEKTVYGRSIPKDEYESKMLEILKLTSDDRFMVEQRILPKLKRLLDTVNETSNKQE